MSNDKWTAYSENLQKSHLQKSNALAIIVLSKNHKSA